MHFARGQDEYNIGRNGKGRTACDYILEDKKISGLHARISRQPDDSAILVDMSTNGTWINGERTGRMARMLLNKGDVLTFGPPTGTIQDYGAPSVHPRP
jgi:pSer/pThr/pTyr-binding forkhead associated (FHA) protein